MAEEFINNVEGGTRRLRSRERKKKAIFFTVNHKPNLITRKASRRKEK